MDPVLLLFVYLRGLDQCNQRCVPPSLIPHASPIFTSICIAILLHNKTCTLGYLHPVHECITTHQQALSTAHSTAFCMQDNPYFPCWAAKVHNWHSNIPYRLTPQLLHIRRTTFAMLKSGLCFMLFIACHVLGRLCVCTHIALHSKNIHVLIWGRYKVYIHFQQGTHNMLV